MQLVRSPGSNISEWLPGLIAMSILFGTTSMLAVTITFERSGRSFERLLAAPISLNTMVLAKLSGTILFGLFNAFVPIILAGFLIDLRAVNAGLVLLAVLFIAVTSALMGLLIAVSAEQVFEAQTFSNFFRFPMLFLCGLFIPIPRLPVFLRPVSYCLPLTYGTDLLRGGITGANALSPLLSSGMLLVFAAALFLICRHNINRKWIL
jgi:ABC-2 type transport system permease protein